MNRYLQFSPIIKIFVFYFCANPFRVFIRTYESFNFCIKITKVEFCLFPYAMLSRPTVQVNVHPLIDILAGNPLIRAATQAVRPVKPPKPPPKPQQLHYCEVCKISCAGPQTYKVMFLTNWDSFF